MNFFDGKQTEQTSIERQKAGKLINKLQKVFAVRPIFLHLTMT